MTQRGLAWTLCSLALGLALGTGACSDDHSHDDGSHQHGHDPKNPSCAAIMRVCHRADLGPGPAHECHTLAATDVEADCAAQSSSCVALCDAILADAGID